MIRFIFNDGGRKVAGYKGTTGDCVTRAIAIVTGKPYKEVYDALFEGIKEFAQGRSKASARTNRTIGLKGTTPRNGIHRKVYHKYLISLGYKWIPTMLIGQGCKVHLKEEELPLGRLIVRVSKHLTAVINGVVHDIFNPAREGTVIEYGHGKDYGKTFIHEHNGRCVYGYYILAV